MHLLNYNRQKKCPNKAGKRYFGMRASVLLRFVLFCVVLCYLFIFFESREIQLFKREQTVVVVVVFFFLSFDFHDIMFKGED